jgi:hypothetical protein
LRHNASKGSAPQRHVALPRLAPVDKLFRTAKAQMRTRSVYHPSGEAIRDHVRSWLLRDELCKARGLAHCGAYPGRARMEGNSDLPGIGVRAVAVEMAVLFVVSRHVDGML